MNKSIYFPNEKDTARFLLGEQSDSMLACLGINPSTARPGALDRTLQSVVRIATHNGYSGYLMLNVYPQRATNPEDLHKRINKAYHRQNVDAIVQAIHKYKVDTLWLAYGDLIDHRKYFQRCLQEIYEALEIFDLNYVVAGTLTAKGNPRHPLYQAAKSQLEKLPANAVIGLRQFQK